MKIEFNGGSYHYYDVNGKEIHEGDVVEISGKKKRVLLTEYNELGTDATNPAWIASGRAYEGEYGVYPFEKSDEPTLVEVNA